MARVAKFEPYKEATSGKWVVSIPPALSPTKRRKREFFDSKKVAEARTAELKTTLKSGNRAAQVAGPELIRVAINYHELFRDVYGFDGGLEEACETFARHLDETRGGLRFGDLLQDYQATREKNWSVKYARNWKWFRGIVESLSDTPLVTMSSDFWSKWLDAKADEQGWGDRTFNDVTSMLSSIWNASLKKGTVDRNPLEGVHRRKIRRQAKQVYAVEEVRILMDCAWEHDRELVPYFAIAIFAGLRPDENSEITALDWSDVNLEEGWIRVAANFDNKTETKRFVHIESNLRLWLEPWSGRNGPVVPPNLRSRRRWLTRGKYQCPPGTPPSKWKQLVPFGSEVRDITRHTYGSYLEAKYKDRNRVKESMGHTDFRTYEQHYRNARSPREAEEFWSIAPPTLSRTFSNET